MSRGSVPFKHPWGEALVGEVANVVVGGTPSTAEPSLWDGEIRWMVSGDVHQRHIFDVPGRISEAGLRWSNAAMVEPKAVAMALAGQGKTRGTVALTHVPICTNQSIALIKPKDERLDPEFLYQSLIPRYEEMRARSAGGGRAGLTKWILEQLPLQLPLAIEQRRIAEVLSTLDEALEQTEALIAKYQQIKAGLMQDLFTRGVTADGRLRPPHAQAPHLYKESPIGWIPKKWEFCTLASLYSEPSKNGLYKPATNYGSGVRMVHMPQMFRSTVVELSDAPRVRIETTELGRFSLMAGDLLFARRSLTLEGAGRCSLVPTLQEPATFESSIIRVRLDQQLALPSFVNCYLSSGSAYRFRLRVIRQVAVSGVAASDIATLPVPRPTTEEQHQIVDRLVTSECHIEEQQANAFKLSMLKHGLMHDLLTGRVRVKVAEPQGAPA